jgi:hypothetical protein
MKKTTIIVLVLILTGVFSGVAYSENTGMGSNDWYFVTAQAETSGASGEQAKTTAAAEEKKPAKATAVSEFEGEEWNWDETMHDY